MKPAVMHETYREGKIIHGVLISRHRTMEAAETAITTQLQRQRRQPGQQNTGTFRLAVDLDDEYVVCDGERV